jgi:hypothetical protein
MPRGVLPTIPIEVHSAILVAQQVGAGQRIIAGVPVFSSDLHRMQVGEGFWGDVWSGVKSGFQTIFKTGTSILKDIINPEVDIKQTVSRRVGEATSHLLDQGVEALRRRTGKRKGGDAGGDDQTGSGGRKRRRLPTVADNMKTLQYKTCPGGQKLSVISRRLKGRRRRRKSTAAATKKGRITKRSVKRRRTGGKRKRRTTKRSRQRRTVVSKSTRGRKRRGGGGRRKKRSRAQELGF